MKFKATILFLVIATFVFAQKKKEIVITGTVYINSSVSLGVRDAGSIEEPEHIFKYQTIYFQSDSLPVYNATTDSIGKFSIKLIPAVYTIYQSEGFKKQETKGLQSFGTYVINMNNDKGPYKIVFQNHSNRRAVKSGMEGMPGAKPVKTQKK